MGLILSPDDISVGDFVTTYGLVDHESSDESKQKAFFRKLREVDFGPEGVIVSKPKMPVPPGYPMRILQVSLPFVACAVIEPGGTEGGPAIIDLRTFRLCRIADEYVNAIKGFKDEDDHEIPF